VKITHYGKTAAALVPAKDLKLLEDCEARDAAASARKKLARQR
jgi:hypothetical protein